MQWQVALYTFAYLRGYSDAAAWLLRRGARPPPPAHASLAPRKPPGRPPRPSLPKTVRRVAVLQADLARLRARRDAMQRENTDLQLRGAMAVAFICH